jgi:hypothetical protein
MKITQNNNGMSEIIGTVLLLGIAVLAMSVIYLQFLTDDGPTPETHINIAGDIINEKVILTHKGGESIGIDDEIKFTIGEIVYTNKTRDLLIDENNNSKWDFGEKVLFDFEVNLSRLDDYEFIDVTGIDGLSNSIVFQGPVYTKYRSDIGIDVIVNNSYPTQNQTISITISVWCYGGDVEGAGNVSINCSLPDGLLFINSTADQGYYDNVSGVWHLGNLLVENSPINLTIIARVTGATYHEPTQLGMILDGAWIDNSFGTSPDKWNSVMMLGIDKAVEDDSIFPHDGSIEFTVVKYGFDAPPHPEIVLMPTLVTEDNYQKIVPQNTSHPRGHSPLASAIRYIADLMHDDGDFSPDKRQVILLVTAGFPDCIWIPGGYTGVVSSYTEAKANATDALEMMSNILEFNETQDEFNVIAVGKYGVDIDFLNSSMIFPQPGYVAPPLTSPGWVYNVSEGWKDFQESLNLILKLLLNSIRIQVTLEGSTTIDPNSNNNMDIINIQPTII